MNVNSQHQAHPTSSYAPLWTHYTKLISSSDSVRLSWAILFYNISALEGYLMPNHVLNIYVYISSSSFIISRWQHGYPWPSLATPQAIVHCPRQVFRTTTCILTSCCMYVRAGRPAFARPCVGIHKSTSLMSSSLLLQQCPACLVRLTWIVFVIGGRWPYSWCLVGCCCQDLFRIAPSILV